MSAIFTSVDQLIGKTPLLELTRLEQAEGLQATVLAKLEYFNPAGSAKDRVARAMIDDAEAKGLRNPSSLNPLPATPASVSPLSARPAAIA